MNFNRLIGLLGALGWLMGCSGRYQVGASTDAAGSANSSGTVGSAGSTPGTAGSAGTDAGSDSVAGGASSVDPGPAESATYCTVALPSTHNQNLASPALVYSRIFSFLANLPLLPEVGANLPQVTTRTWAGDTALAFLDSLNVPSAAGLNRFVSTWWPGTPTPELWASYFSSRRGTLANLLTDVVAMPHGSGVLTDPAVLRLSSISARGTFLFNRLFCQTVPLAPGAIMTVPAMPGLSRRAQLQSAVANPACTACHQLIDPLGYAVDDFTVDGSYRPIDNGLPVDTSSVVRLLPSGSSLAFTDVSDFGRQAANTCDIVLCFTRQLLADAQLSAGLGVADNDGEIAEIAQGFSRGGLDLRGLVRAIVESDSFLRPE